MKFRDSIVGILMFFAFLTVPALKAQDGLQGAFSIDSPTARHLAGRSPKVAAADFDNDQKPDGALLLEAGLLNGERAFRVELHITSGTNSAITFSSKEPGLAIAALDINRDGAPDIVIEKAFTHERVQVFLNDGHGTFHQTTTEGYPVLDPGAPAWRARLNPLPPVLGLPVSRGFDIDTIHQASVVRRNSSSSVKVWCEGLLIQSAARAPSSPRAPPSLSL
ncbi:MAG: VCBS repeat-containing protein [Acidobacteria bacterium]|nr:VCBS repeat-containing protein [Acidobacteriota bacterium]